MLWSNLSLGCLPEANWMGYWSLAGGSSGSGAGGDRAVSVNMADSLCSSGREPKSSLLGSLLPFPSSLLFPTSCSHTSNESLSSYTPIPLEAGGGSVNQTLLLFFVYKVDFQHHPQSGPEVICVHTTNLRWKVKPDSWVIMCNLPRVLLERGVYVSVRGHVCRRIPWDVCL